VKIRRLIVFLGFPLVAVWLSPVFASQDDTQEWEYSVIDLRTDHVNAQKQLNDRGREGWGLVVVDKRDRCFLKKRLW